MSSAATCVFLIDDDEADYIRTRRMLTSIDSQRFELDWASSYNAGLDGLRRNMHDVYLIDYCLNGNDGLKLLDEHRKLKIPSPAIVLTGMCDYRIDIEAMKRGAVDYLIKDEITPALLERSIRYAIEHARILKELERQQDEIRASELRFRSIVQSASDGIVIADADSRIMFCNQSAEIIFGYREDEVLGCPLDCLIPEGLRETHRVGFDRYQMNRRSRFAGNTVETGGLRKDGTRVPVELSLASWQTAEGAFFAAIVRDITERRRSEGILLAKEAAEEASRAKSSFVAKTSHELRTPLTAIIGFANLLIQDRNGSLDKQARDYAERILVNAKNQLQLINSMLDLSKIEAGKLDVDIARASLDSIVHEVIRQFDGRRRSEDVSIVLSLPERMAPIATDAVKLKQVLTNLIDNALKFTERGVVKVCVETGPTDSTPFRIEVVDTGPGIPHQRLKDIFEPFQQVGCGKNPRFGGTGLGLSICRSLCDLLGYTLQVQSQPGRGSKFSIILKPQLDQLPLSA